jgi:hypothetical protein
VPGYSAISTRSAVSSADNLKPRCQAEAQGDSPHTIGGMTGCFVAGLSIFANRVAEAALVALPRLPPATNDLATGGGMDVFSLDAALVRGDRPGC